MLILTALETDKQFFTGSSKEKNKQVAQTGLAK